MYKLFTSLYKRSVSLINSIIIFINKVIELIVIAWRGIWRFCRTGTFTQYHNTRNKWVRAVLKWLIEHRDGRLSDQRIKSLAEKANQIPGVKITEDEIKKMINGSKQGNPTKKAPQ